MRIGLLTVLGWAVMAILMAGLWEIQRRRRNAGIVDVAWTLGVGVLAVVFAWGANGYGPRRFLIGALAASWSLRLGTHLLRRITAEREDGRYQALRQRWGNRTQPYMFAFFQVQAIWSVLFALPMLIAAHNPTPSLGVLDLMGLAIGLLSIAGEALADRQLARFRSNPANQGRVCREGLWRYSRHPNYFFEWTHWWAYVCVGIRGPLGGLTLGGPLLMLLFLLKITGIPPTEERALASRGQAYRDYQRTTSAFVPWPPKDRRKS